MTGSKSDHMNVGRTEVFMARMLEVLNFSGAEIVCGADVTVSNVIRRIVSGIEIGSATRIAAGKAEHRQSPSLEHPFRAQLRLI